MSLRGCESDPNLEKFTLFFIKKRKVIKRSDGSEVVSLGYNVSYCMPKPVYNYNFLFEHENDALEYIAWLRATGLGGCDVEADRFWDY